jgi:tRNA pseudouridine38-40 synthase
MTRYRVDISYDGTAFHGWATQPGLRTVQEELETWVARVLRLDYRPLLLCAGRTDAGVHARGQVAHLDLDLPEPTLVAEKLAHKLRIALPRDVAVRSVTVAPPGFDARFAAIWRRYAYRLADNYVDPLDRLTTAVIKGRLDVDLVNTAAQTLLGLHDFAAFCRSRPGATTIRRLQHLHAERLPDGRVEFGVRADAFCHSMVRSLVGGLVEVGTGHRDVAWLAALPDTHQRCGQIRVMAANGLVLEEVGYPPDDQLAQRARESRAKRTMTDGSMTEECE